MTASKPKIVQLRIDQLFVDHTVQRPLDEGRVSRIHKNFRLDALGVVTVSARPDGTYHIIDGQHRVAAAKVSGHGNASIPCLVYSGLTRADEAAMFRHLNDTRQIHSLDKFRVRVVEGDLVAVQLNGMLNANGWQVRAAKNHGEFAAVAALEKVYNGAGITTDQVHFGTCQTLIQVLTSAFGHNPDAVRSEIITGLGMFLVRHGAQADLTKLVTEMGRYEGACLGLLGNAKGLTKLRGGTVGNSMAEIITNLHNKGRRTNRLPEWRVA